MPESIRRFEYLYFTVLAIAVVTALMTYSATMAAMPPQMGGMFLISIWVVSFGLMLALVLLVSRRRKNWAKWVLVAFTVLGVISWLFNASMTFQISMLGGIMGIIQTIMQLAAVYMLFQPDAKAYLGRAET